MNRALAGAKKKGRAAAIAGSSRSGNPYADVTRDGRVTFSRAFYRAWLEGFDEVKGRQSGELNL